MMEIEWLINNGMVLWNIVIFIYIVSDTTLWYRLLSHLFLNSVIRIHFITVSIRLKVVKVSDISVLKLFIVDLKIKRLLKNYLGQKIKAQIKF